MSSNSQRTGYTTELDSRSQAVRVLPYSSTAPGGIDNGKSPLTAAIRTHGCKLNQADSESLAREFIRAGYVMVDWNAGASSADVLVLNTCTVTSVADAKARHGLRSAHRINRHAVIVATGCYAQRAADEVSD